MIAPNDLLVEAHATVQLLSDGAPADDAQFIVLPRTTAARTAYLIGLMSGSITRLQAELDALRAAQAPQRRRRRTVAKPDGGAA